VIDQLDGRRAQVLVESLIVEVNADKAAEFGIQWQNMLGSANSSNIGVLGTNFGVGGTNIISLQQGAAPAPTVPVHRHQHRPGAQHQRHLRAGLPGRFLESPTATATCCPRPTC
jgi:type II secretory pathway component HofQ